MSSPDISPKPYGEAKPVAATPHRWLVTLDPARPPREVHLIPMLYGKLDELKDGLRRICAVKGDFECVPAPWRIPLMSFRGSIHYLNSNGIKCELYNPLMLNDTPTNHLSIVPVAPPEARDPVIPPEIANRCISCNARAWNTICVPCGHPCICLTCADTKRPLECPYCKQPLRGIVLIDYMKH